MEEYQKVFAFFEEHQTVERVEGKIAVLDREIGEEVKVRDEV